MGPAGVLCVVCAFDCATHIHSLLPARHGHGNCVPAAPLTVELYLNLAVARQPTGRGGDAAVRVAAAVAALLGPIAAMTACCGLMAVTVGEVPPSQRAALVDLFTATNGTHWLASTGWLQGDPCARPWWSVYCDSTGSTVTYVSLGGMGGWQRTVGGAREPCTGARTALQFHSTWPTW